MTEVLGVVIIRFWAVAGSSCLEISSCTVSLTVFLVRRGEVFFSFTVKGIVRELPKSFLLLEVGAPNDYRTAFVGRFDSSVLAFTEVYKCGPFIGFEVLS